MSANFFASKLTFRHFLTIGLPVMAAGLIAAGILVFAPGSSTATSRFAKNEGLPVAVTQLSLQNGMSLPHEFTGTIAPARASELSFDQPGLVAEVLVEEGDWVQRDAVLARLDGEHLIAQRNQIEAELREAQAVLAELTAGPRKETIAAAKASVEELAAQLELTKADYLRERRLAETRATTQDDLDAAHFGFLAAKARLEKAQQQLDELNEGTRSEQLEAQRSRVASLTSRLAAVDVEIADLQLVAPFAGQVTARHYDEGAVVDAGTHVLRIVEEAPTEFRVGLPTDMVDQLSTDKAYSVRVGNTAYEATLKARLAEIDRSTRTQTVLFELSATPRDVAIHSLGRIALKKHSPTTGMWIPLEAVAKSDEGLWMAYALMEEEGKTSPFVQRRDVEVLAVDGDRAFVRGTLYDGEWIVATGVHRITNGQQVAPISATADQTKGIVQ